MMWTNSGISLTSILPKWLPVIPIFDPANFLRDIHNYMKAGLEPKPPVSLKQDLSAFKAIHYLAGIWGDVAPAETLRASFPRLRDMSKAIRTNDGIDRLNACFHRGETNSIVRFLLEEWPVD